MCCFLLFKIYPSAVTRNAAAESMIKSFIVSPSASLPASKTPSPVLYFCILSPSIWSNENSYISHRVPIASAKEKGAEEVITACPLCLYNLQVNGGDILPVKYFTELLAEALGVNE